VHAETGVHPCRSLHVAHRQVVRQRPLEAPDALLEVDTGPVDAVAEPLGDPGSLGERAVRPLQHIERGPQVGDRVVPGVHAGRHLAGPQQQLHRLALVGQRAGQAEMEGGGGDPSGVERPVGLDRLGGTEMQPLPAGQAEVPIQRLPGESVPERIGRHPRGATLAEDGRPAAPLPPPPRSPRRPSRSCGRAG
jgi:hypothetical protein